MAVTLFFCYAREDEALLNRLKTHLLPLKRLGCIDIWYDRNISAGAEWDQEISQHLNTAQIILLLVSPDFINSDYCYSIEMKQALERHAKNEATVIPIILHPVHWHGEPLAKLQALPTDGKPVTGSAWHNINSALYDVVQGIDKVIKQLMAPIRTPFAVEKLIVLHTLTGHTMPVTSVALSADGETLVSGSEDKMIKVWSLSTGKEVCTLTGHTKSSLLSMFSGICVAISADGETLVSGSDDSTIKVWGV